MATTISKCETVYSIQSPIYFLLKGLLFLSCQNSLGHSINKMRLMVSSSEGRASRNHLFHVFGLHEMLRSALSNCLFAEVKPQWTMLILGWVIALVPYSCLWWLCGSCYPGFWVLQMFERKPFVKVKT